MTITLENTLTTPQAGEIWTPTMGEDSVVVTGVINEELNDKTENIQVYFSTLSSIAYSSPLAHFVENYNKRN